MSAPIPAAVPPLPITWCVSALTPPVRTSATEPIFQISVSSAGTAPGTIEFVTVRLSDGKLGHDASSRRYKQDIKPMGDASELIYKLKPVTYHFKEIDVDPNIRPQPQNLDYGLSPRTCRIDPSGYPRGRGKSRASAIRRSTLCCSTSFSKSIAEARNKIARFRSRKRRLDS